MAKSPVQWYQAAVQRGNAKTTTADLVFLRRMTLFVLWFGPPGAVFGGVVVLIFDGDVRLGVTALALAVFIPLVFVRELRRIDRDLTKRRALG